MHPVAEKAARSCFKRGGQPFPYHMGISLHRTLPASNADCNKKLT